MTESVLLHELIAVSAQARAQGNALTLDGASLNYGQLQEETRRFANGLGALGLEAGGRVAIYLEKRFETVIASFGAVAAGGVFVPVNPLLKPDQVAFILRDCNVRVLVTSSQRFDALAAALANCPELKHIVLTEAVTRGTVPEVAARPVGAAPHGTQMLWHQLLDCPAKPGHRVIDTDVAAILYTSGSTGSPKGVVLSHRNMVAGAKSVASYLGNSEYDTLLAALPLSFDAGFSQLTTAFHAGARVVLLNYLMPRDVLKALASERVTGLTAVPPLYIQLAQQEWPGATGEHLRYFASTGGRMPLDTLSRLRQKLPKARPFLMYGLTEAFRSTFLPPEDVDRRPDSIGKAIPNAEILVLRPDGAECAADEPGELVHRGPLVGLGYWNDAAKTAERFKPLPRDLTGSRAGLQLPEIAVFSGDTVRRDSDGFLYFVGRSDDMIKTSGYRVSPTEVEEILYSTGLVAECVAFGVDHPQWGQAIQIIATNDLSTGTSGENELEGALLSACRTLMPAYMLPAGIELVPGPLPRNPNGKIDRNLLTRQWFERRATPGSRELNGAQRWTSL